jgi:hypothetical protein
MTTYKWVISKLDTKPQQDDLTNVVVTIHCRYQGEDGLFNGDTYGALTLSTAPDPEFVPYSELTEAQITTWLETGLDIVLLKSIIDSQIELQRNPPTINLPLPWATV